VCGFDDRGPDLGGPLTRYSRITKKHVKWGGSLQDSFHRPVAVSIRICYTVFLLSILGRFLSRFKRAIQNHPELRDFVEDLFRWYSRWATAIKASPPAFADSIAMSSPEICNLTLAELEKDVGRLRLIADREYGHAERMRRPVAHVAVTADQMQQALTSRLSHTYEPPGTLRDGGTPRHDNDFTDIRDIRIAPTHGELLCPLPPYLPVFLPAAPHHLPENSVQRHLDIQFRLLREEMM
jgi:hypothetical protein